VSEVVAGIDIGNSTTEVVLARVAPSGIDVIGTARAATRRGKGSPESLDGAAALVARLEREHDTTVARAAAAWLRPVQTLTTSLPPPDGATGRLRVASAGSATAGGAGFAAGRPHLLGATVPAGGDALVVIVPSGTGYRETARQVEDLRSRARVVAVVLADDEAVLVSNRLHGQLPVVDEADLGVLLAARQVAVEVAAPGAGLRMLTDPLRLIAELGLDAHERADAARLSQLLGDCSNAAVAVAGTAAPAQGTRFPAEETSFPAQWTSGSGWVQAEDGLRVPFPAAHDLLASGIVGTARRYAVPPVCTPVEVDDLWSVHLTSVAGAVLARQGVTGTQSIGIASLRADAPLTDPSGPLSQRLGVPVLAGSESRAAWAGGCSSPGAAPGQAGDTIVIDVGGGTIDAVWSAGAVVAAGGGQLLTASVAALTGCSAAAAEWVKRVPAQRVEAPQVLLGEDGSRTFADRPAPGSMAGSLVVPGPAGLLPFSQVLAPGEWRALRLRVKVAVLGANVARTLRTLDIRPSTVVLVGGPAGDDEVLNVVARALPDGVVVGRGDVGGRLGHRYAVAYGLLGLVGAPLLEA
jgi:hypothetical protein